MNEWMNELWYLQKGLTYTSETFSSKPAPWWSSHLPESCRAVEQEVKKKWAHPRLLWTSESQRSLVITFHKIFINTVSTGVISDIRQFTQHAWVTNKIFHWIKPADSNKLSAFLFVSCKYHYSALCLVHSLLSHPMFPHSRHHFCFTGSYQFSPGHHLA